MKTNNPHNIQVGQTIYSISKRTGKIETDEVTSVGRQYFYVNKTKVHFDTLRSVGDWPIQFYLTEQEILDMWERSRLKRFIQDELYMCGDKRFTLDQLRRIKDIINEKTENDATK